MQVDGRSAQAVPLLCRIGSAFHVPTAEAAAHRFDFHRYENYGHLKKV